MSHRLEIFDNGEASLRDIELNQTMHSSIGACQEAQTIYILPSELKTRLQTSLLPPIDPSKMPNHGIPSCNVPDNHIDDHQTLVLWDIGLGTAANAIAAIDVFFNCQAQRNLHIISFESDLSGLETALNNIQSFSYLKKYQTAAQELLEHGHWQCQPDIGRWIKWDLLTGDFREHLHNWIHISTQSALTPEVLETSNSFSSIQNSTRVLHTQGADLQKVAKPLVCPEIVYFDLYAPKVCPELWSSDVFTQIFEYTLPIRQKGGLVTLHTYSAASSVKRALSAAGFKVLKGPGTELKRETTLAIAKDH